MWAARKELKYRQEHYPRLVGAKRMNPFDAEDGIAEMAAIVRTLARLANA